MKQGLKQKKRAGTSPALFSTTGKSTAKPYYLAAGASALGASVLLSFFTAFLALCAFLAGTAGFSLAASAAGATAGVAAASAGLAASAAKAPTLIEATKRPAKRVDKSLFMVFLLIKGLELHLRPKPDCGLPVMRTLRRQAFLNLTI